MAAAQSSKASKADTPVHVFHPFPIKYIPVNGSTKCCCGRRTRDCKTHGRKYFCEHGRQKSMCTCAHCVAPAPASMVDRRACAHCVAPAPASMIGRRASAHFVAPAPASMVGRRTCAHCVAPAPASMVGRRACAHCAAPVTLQHLH
jgi:hypothetical protein